MLGHTLGRSRLALVAVSVTLGLAGSAGSADASTTFSQLPLNGFRSIVVDDAGGHVFVSGSPVRGDDAVVVAGFDGVAVKTISGIPGASGLARDGDRIYVADCGASQLSVIDATALAVTETIDSGAAIGGTCQVAVASGRVWFISDQGLLASVSEASPHVSATYAALGTFSAPLVKAAGSRLVLADTNVNFDLGTPLVHVYDLSQGAPQLVVAGYPDFAPYGVTNFGDATLSADGSTLVMAGPVTAQVDPTDLSIIRFYEAHLHNTVGPFSSGGVVLSPDGRFMVASSSSTVYSFFTSDRFVRAVRAGPILYARSVALSADGRRMFAVGGHQGYPENQDAYLWVMDGPALAPVSLTLAVGTHWIVAGKTVHLTAHVTHVAADSLIRIYATSVGHPRRLVATGHPDRAGNFSVTLRPGRNTHYDAETPAGTTYGSATAPKKPWVFVRARVTAKLSGYYGSSGSYLLYHYTTACPRSHRGCPTVTAVVHPNHAGKLVYVTLQELIAGHWRTAFQDPYKLNSHSRAKVLTIYRSSTIIGKNFRVEAYFDGDADHESGTSRWHYFRITR